MDLARAGSGAPAPAPTTRRLRDLVGGAWPAVVGLFLVALLQNVDVILVKRQIGGDAAGAYAAAAVAAKAVVWVAIGIGLYLLPEATRAARHGQDPRPVLARALAVVAAVAVPMLIVYGLFPSTVLRLAFGPETVVASDALFVLGLRDDAAGRRLPRRPVHARARARRRSCRRWRWSRWPSSRC